MKEKSRNKWLAAGDRNSAFFHQQLARNKSKRGILQLQVDGTITDDKQVITDNIIAFYQNLFRADASVQSNFQRIKYVIPSLVSDEENSSLIRCPSMDEIKDTVFRMDANSAPGPDGFTGLFYQTFWDVVNLDVCSAVQSFFKHGLLTSGANSSIMVLIPKVANAIAIE